MEDTENENTQRADEKTTKKVVLFQEFTALGDYFNRIIGMQPYQEGKLRWGINWMNILFFLNLANLDFWGLGELLFIIQSFRTNTNMVDANLMISFFTVILIANIKMLNVMIRKKQVVRLIKDLRAIFPIDYDDQLAFEIHPILEFYKGLHYPYMIIHICTVWLYTVYFIVLYYIDHWFLAGTMGPPFPYKIWFPFRYYDNWFYYYYYCACAIGASAGYMGQISADSLLYISMTQLTMHFNYLARRVREYEPGVGTWQQDLSFISKIVNHHQKVLKLSNLMNTIFGIPLFITFMLSTVNICFVAFQVTNGTKDILWLMAIYLVSVLVQVSIISWYGQRLLISSESIGIEAYNQNWFNADLRYKKMLLLLMQRSQNVTMLKATNFLPISMVTVTDLIQNSYKFFTLLQTIYGE